MNMNFFFFFLLAVFSVTACNFTKKTTSGTIENTATNNSHLPDSIYRFTVSFISKASGIDRLALEQFEQFIQQYNQQNNVKINVEITPWGREGEKDYCLKLNELNSPQQEQFISQAKDLLISSDRVRYKENEVCRYKKQ